MTVPLTTFHVTALLAAVETLLAFPTVRPEARWISGSLATLSRLLGGTNPIIGVAHDDDDVQWHGESRTSAVLRALADPAREPTVGRAHRAARDVVIWLADRPYDVGSRLAFRGAGPIQLDQPAAGLHYVDDRTRLHFVCLLPQMRPGRATTRTRALLNLIAPIFAAGVRAHTTAADPLLDRSSGAMEPRPGADTDTSELLVRAIGEEYGLTPREIDVVELLVQGSANAGIARALRISESTARHHTERVITKLGVRSRAEVPWVVVGRRATPPTPHAAVRAGSSR